MNGRTKVFVSSTMSFLTKLTSVYQTIRRDPSCLRQVLPAMKAKLHSQGNLLAQGTGNQPTDQECSFAAVLETHGFVFQPKGFQPSDPGLYYLYQVNGSQQSLDFQVYEMTGVGIGSFVNLDLKHTTTDVFYLNDGWFHKDVVYIVTWERRTSLPRTKKATVLATFLGLGQDIPSAEESALMSEMIAMKNKYNAESKGVGSLCTYVRFANRYKCDRFTPESTETCFQAVLDSLPKN